VQFIISGGGPEGQMPEFLKLYKQYLEFLNRTKPAPDAIETHAFGYEDTLQAPLQVFSQFTLLYLVGLSDGIANVAIDG
jgi:hypothetical protein